LHRRAATALAAGAAHGVPVAPAELASHHERGREPAAALRAYSMAAQAALRSFAPLQAFEICEHALTLLPQIPPGPEKLMLELDVQSPRGVAAALLFGLGSPEPRAVYGRVRELCELLPQHPARAVLLNGYGASLFARAEYAKLQEFAEKLDQLEGPDRGPLMVMTALFRAGAASARGECRVSTEWWLRAIAICESITERSGFQPFIVDPEVGIRANSVGTLYERGLFDQARAQAEKAVILADSIGQPLAQCLARWRAGMLEVRFDNPRKVMEHADEIGRVVATSSVTQGDGPGRYLRGWAMARLGQPREGLALIREGLALDLRIGMLASSTEVMGYAAEALVLAQDWQGARDELAQAFARARELDEHVYLPVLLMLQARVAAGQGDEAAAYQWLRKAVDMARSQEAMGFQLKAACALVAHPASTAGDREELAELSGRLTEGHDAPEVLQARQSLSGKINQ
jgi:tetratricopeptide (TPR) repeat protein